MRIENTVFFISLFAMAYPILRLVHSVIRELRATKLVVTDHNGKVMAEFTTERVQQTDLEDLERLHERVRREKGAELRAAA
jgi:predicted transcriptional regulator